MTQSAFIAGSLLAAFVLYVAAKGRFGVYTSILWGPTPASSGGSYNSSQTLSALPNVAGAATSSVPGALVGALIQGLGVDL